MGNLSRLSRAKTRSISAENFTGEKGKAGWRRKGPGRTARRATSAQGWKISPCGQDQSQGDVHRWRRSRVGGDPADLDDPHRPLALSRSSAIYWDGETDAFRGSARRRFLRLRMGRVRPDLARCRSASTRAAHSTATGRCRSARSCRITVENHRRRGDDPLLPGQLHADRRAGRRRVLPCPVPARQSAALQSGVHHPRRRARDGDTTSGRTWPGASTTPAGGAKARSSSSWTATRNIPTICGTGTEDYFCGSYNFENQKTKQYQEFTTPYSGLPQVIRPDGVYSSQQRFGLYRWHIMDPIRFEKDLRVTIQALGWRSGGRYLPLQDDIASVAFWYQTEPHAPFPKLPDEDYLEVK